jgi:D-inositol-3-phosphate glycosyltransferase
MTNEAEIRSQRSAVGLRKAGACATEGDRRSAGSGQLLESGGKRGASSHSQPSALSSQRSYTVALLSGGGDKPYALGLSAALTSEGVLIEFIGSDHLNVPELVDNPRIRFLNLRDQRQGVGRLAKVLRILIYYARIVGYVPKAKPKIFHILWNNKLELFDRTLLMAYYKVFGKRVVFTAHNVNARKRDGNDSVLNRLSLGIQYRLCDQIFVHTEQMKRELSTDFVVEESKVRVVPFGINNTVPNTSLSPAEARHRLGINRNDKTLLFFGNITPYKGLECLIPAFAKLVEKDGDYRLIIAGRPKGSEAYWRRIEREIAHHAIGDRIIQKIEYIPDDETELYFKAADVLLLPYTRIFQSGVLFLGYSFGLPAIASDVGSLRDEIVEGKSGFVFKSQDSADLARVIGEYFESELFSKLESYRAAIKEYANERYSWDKVAGITTAVYSDLLGI